MSEPVVPESSLGDLVKIEENHYEFRFYPNITKHHLARDIHRWCDYLMLRGVANGFSVVSKATKIIFKKEAS